MQPWSSARAHQRAILGISPRGWCGAVLVEDGVSGGTTAAPRVKQLLANVFREVDGLEGMPLPSPVEVPTELPVEEPA